MFNNDLDRIKNDPDYRKREIKKTEAGMFLALTFFTGLLGYIWISTGSYWGDLLGFFTIALLAVFVLSILTIKSPLKVICGIGAMWRKGLKHLTGL